MLSLNVLIVIIPDDVDSKNDCVDSPGIDLNVGALLI